MCTSTRFKPEENFTKEIVEVNGKKREMIAVWKILIKRDSKTDPVQSIINIFSWQQGWNKAELSRDSYSTSLESGFHTYFHEQDANKSFKLWLKLWQDEYGYKQGEILIAKMHVDWNDVKGIGYSLYSTMFILGYCADDYDTFEHMQANITAFPTLVANRKQNLFHRKRIQTDY